MDRRARSATGSAEDFAHDPLHGAEAAPALDAATKATVDLMCTERLLPRCRHHVSYLVVSQYVAGADNHLRRVLATFKEALAFAKTCTSA
jgi:hypothetical protein